MLFKIDLIIKHRLKIPGGVCNDPCIFFLLRSDSLMELKHRFASQTNY